MKHGFIKVAAATPALRVADPTYNAAVCAALAREASDLGVKVLTFPELCLTGATCGDLYAHSRLLDGALEALATYTAETAELDLVSIVGLPVSFADRIYNSAAVVSGGTVLGLVPKTVLTAAERRTFTPAPAASLALDVLGDGSFVQMGAKQVFVCTAMPSLRIGVELGADLFATIPPSSTAVSAGATLICNPAAVPEIVGQEAFCRMSVTSQSARGICAYVFANAGDGESTTDSVYGGHAIIAEGGEVLGERAPFDKTSLTVTEVDLDRLVSDRRTAHFDTSACGEYTEAYFALVPEDTELTRSVSASPFVPADAAERARRAERILTIQASGLARRITAAHARRLVLGISGGLDSTLALLVAVRALDLLERPHADMLAITMPCFGTTARTKNNATLLCDQLGVEMRTVDIFDAVSQHFSDIGHDPAVRDVTYENSQARERTQILMDVANDENGLVVGTGDLSELALGWATYNGDHMSMYSVNGGVPKTLVRHLVSYAADTARAEGRAVLADALTDILATPVSPELLPADESGEIAQKTEDLVGPYELHDFYLYYLLRYGFAPEKLFRLARYAFAGVYDDATLIRWLEVFTRRFFTQQFKRSCLPDGPKVGSVGVSPRGDLRMPSDASSALWLADVQALKDAYL